MTADQFYDAAWIINKILMICFPPKEYMDQVEAAREAIIAGELDVIDIRVLPEDQLAAFTANPTCAGVEEVRAMMAES